MKHLAMLSVIIALLFAMSTVAVAGVMVTVKVAHPEGELPHENPYPMPKLPSELETGSDYFRLAVSANVECSQVMNMLFEKGHHVSITRVVGK